MKIYIAGPISGMSGEEVMAYFEKTRELLLNMGYEVLSPMTGKGQFRNEIKFKKQGYAGHPIITNHAIFERDHWMVCQADIIYTNLTLAKIVSIGSVMELAWASHMGKHTIVSMEKDNIHQHAFVIEAADVIFDTHNKALDYLVNLANE